MPCHCDPIFICCQSRAIKHWEKSSIYESTCFHPAFSDIWSLGKAKRPSGKLELLAMCTWAHKRTSVSWLWNNWLKTGLFRGIASTGVMTVRKRKGSDFWWRTAEMGLAEGPVSSQNKAACPLSLWSVAWMFNHMMSLGWGGLWGRQLIEILFCKETWIN